MARNYSNLAVTMTPTSRLAGVSASEGARTDDDVTASSMTVALSLKASQRICTEPVGNRGAMGKASRLEQERRGAKRDRLTRMESNCMARELPCTRARRGRY
jgi:hypothetical protein